MFSKILGYIRSTGFISWALLLGYLINPFNYGHFIGFLLIVWIIFKIDFVKKNLDLDFVLLLFFSSTYGLFYAFDPIAGIQFIFVFIFTPPFLYLWGKFLASKTRNTEQLFYLLMLLGFIVSLAPLISVSLDILEGGFVQPNRSIPMFWGGEPKNATGMAAPFIMNMCIPAIMLSSFKKMSKTIKYFFLSLFVLSFICVLRLGSRTQLVIVLFTFLIGLLYLIPKQSLKQNAILFGILLLAVFLVFRNVSFDLDSDWLTSFAGRMEKKGAADIASGGGRTERWIKSIDNLFDKPLGWGVEEFGYAHNLWFDVLRVGGIVSFILLIVFTTRSLLQMKKTIKVDRKNISINILVFSYMAAFMLLFMVEPIIDGSFFLFVIFCMFMGIINKYRTIKSLNP